MERWMKKIGISCGWLLVLGAALHAYGSLTLTRWGSELQVWALSGSLAAALVATLNLVRTHRSDDTAVTWMALGFGNAIGRIREPRVLWHACAGAALAVFSLRQLMEQPMQTPA